MPINIKQITTILSRLFGTTSRISARAGRGLVNHGVGRYAANAVEKLDFRTASGIRISYKDLNEFDKAVVDEVVQCTTRFAVQYMEHHDPNVDYHAGDEDDIVDMLLGHSGAIIDAANNALYSRAKSRGYDLVFGKPKRIANFQDEDYMKQLVLAVIQEYIDHIVDPNG